MSDKGDIQDRISHRAHEIWEREGHPHGRHDEHWAQAEAEIRAEDGAKPAQEPQGAAGAGKASAKGTRAAAENLSTVEAAGSTPAASKTMGKAAGKPGKTSAAKPTDAKPARTPRKDGGKSASPH